MSPIPKGSTVLVTGANGYLASHIVDQLLANGYKVKGTVRAEEKGKWLADYFAKQYGPDKLELAIVTDMSKPAAFDDAMVGCSGVVHVASDLSFSRNAQDVIPGVEAAIKNILSSATKHKEIKRFVLTSSSAAAVFPIPGKKFTVSKDSWNDFSVDKAWGKDGEDDPALGYHVYCASKVAAEKALWEFVKQQKPSFEANAVLPNYIMGKVLGRPWGQSGSTGGGVVNLYAGDEEGMKSAMGLFKMTPPQWMVNAGDTARLHVAALVDPEIVNERLFGFAETYTFNEILDTLQKLRPDHKFPPKIDDNSHDLSTIEGRDRADEVLKKHFGKGFRGLEESIKESIEGL